VGRFNVKLQIVNDSERREAETLLQALKVPEVQDSKHSVQYMPPEIPNFEWRIRIEIRAGLDMPLNSRTPHKMPSIYVETAWSPTIHYDDLYASTVSLTKAVKHDRHPHWNHQLLITNPPVNPQTGGFIFVSLTD
jgi:hypothetical protein